MSAATETKKGLLANLFTGDRWNSRITSANTTKKEMWLGYVLGTYGMVLTSSIVNSYYNKYLTDVLGFTADKGAWIITFMVLFPLLSKLIDGVTNIVMSKIIDSTTCKQGKARPWLIVSAPLVLISVMLLFWMPFADLKWQAIWAVITFNLYYSVAYTMWNMPKELMPALSTRNVNQRKNLSMAATITMNIGTGLVSILFPSILAAVCAAVHGNDAQGYFLTMSVIGVLGMCLAFVQYFYTRERVTEERRNQGIQADANKLASAKPEISLGEQFKTCIKDKYWVIFIVLVLIFFTLTNLRNISLIYYSGWVVHGNSYGEAGAVQAKFQMIALSPMGPGILLMLPLVKKWGRRKTIWVTATLTIIGSIFAYMSIGRGTMIYAGTALAAIGNIAFSYLLMTYLGDVIDHVEWKTGKRCDGITGGVVNAFTMFAVGIAQGVFNLGLGLSRYTQPVETGAVIDGIKQYADQPAAATNWINFSYQGSYIIVGILVFVLFLFFFDIEKHLPTVEKELQERKVAECAARGIEYIPADELQRREIEQQEQEAEEARIRELREKCEKKGLDFEAENAKVLAKRAEQKAKADMKAAKRAARANKKK